MFGQIIFFWIFKNLLWDSTFAIVIFITVLKTLINGINGGEDSNHQKCKKIKVDKNWLFVDFNYHALHHMFPDRYFGSLVKLYDYVAGTAICLRQKKVGIIGPCSDIESLILRKLSVTERLSSDVVIVNTEGNNEDLAFLKGIDVLILNETEKAKEYIECFLRQNSERLYPPDIWHFQDINKKNITVAQREDCVYRRILIDKNSIEYVDRFVFLLQRDFRILPMISITSYIAHMLG
ncbi:hypothetical protein O9G_006263 [Rozella allomycis CSF55]|uniref:Uncharacterized protein n=1 Tax=Rozella allomycis (strain CSF55) TaxID=988480 RepID=A0A075B395_ROZAC|nr:hypothetical protein O9G_006263 [Rozella allomycis CSF55]|eukprot:EPZ37020.1 hypothetical protein O9G_006263 [Rozella allomycis CSF55]